MGWGHVLPNDMLNSLKILKQGIKSSSTFSTSSATVCGEAVGIAVYKGHNNKYYFRPAETQCEVRLFENLPMFDLLKIYCGKIIFHIQSKLSSLVLYLLNLRMFPKMNIIIGKPMPWVWR